jgi:outer membrane protein assembly factor BamA
MVGVLSVLLAGAALAAAQAPQKLIVQDVIPQGNRNVPTQKVMSLIKTRPGADYSRETANDDVRRLLDTKLFANVRVQLQHTPDGKVIVYFLLAELPNMVQEIVYQGARHLDDDELETLTGLRKGMPMNPMANRLARDAILRKYHEKGRLHARVDLVEGNSTSDRRVVFNIHEGPVVKVSDIDIVGSSFVGEARLKTQLMSSSAFLGILGGDFNPAMIDADVNKLEEYYKTYGFHDVKVSRELIWTDDQMRSVKVVFHIHEGERYKVGSVDVVGNRHFDRDRLLAGIRLQPGEIYDRNVVRADQSAIKDLYGYTGRDTSVEERLIYKPSGEVDVRYVIEERPPARVGEVLIIGNEVTRDNVIRRHIPLLPGQILTYPDLRVAEANLARLNIFEYNPEAGIRPTVTILNPDDDNPYKTVLVNVQETHTGSLLFGVGINSDAGLTGSIVLNERNFDILRPPTSIEDILSGRAFRGGGQEFRIEAVPGNELQRYTISWREPFLLDSPYSLALSGYYFTRRYIEYDESRLGPRITVGRRFGPRWSATAAMRLEQVGISNVSIFEPFDIQDVVGDNFLLGFRGGVTYDSRDSYLRATQGGLYEVAVEQVVGSFDYPVITLEGNKYFTLYQRPDGSGRHVLALRSMVGYAGANTPVYERFYAGGFRSMRGFSFRGVGPQINGFKVGGDFIFLNSAEYQLPILPNDQLYAVAFVDSGTVESNVEINNYRVAAGFGLRIVVPMMGPVPIALDFGFPIVKNRFDDEQLFSFWVGFFH